MHQTESLAHRSKNSLRKARVGPGALISLVVLGVAVFAGSAASNSAHAQIAPAQNTNINLSGQWTTSQIQCPLGNYITETVTISHIGSQLSAVKVNGDACVPTGYTAFKGAYSQNGWELTCTAGEPGKPASQQYPGTLNILNTNSLTACGVQYVRAGGAAPRPVTQAPGYPATTPSGSGGTPDYTKNLVGSTWAYSYAGEVYQFKFGATKLDIKGFANPWFPNVSWSLIGTNRIKFFDNVNRREMVVTLNSPTTFGGTDFDQSNPISGSRLGGVRSAVPIRPPGATASNSSSTTTSSASQRVKTFSGEYEKFKTDVQAQGVTIVDDKKGKLSAGSFKDIDLGQLVAGYEYGLAVLCDDLCKNIDLTLTDGSGRKIAVDQDIARATHLEVIPAQKQRYKARVTMSNCSSNPCLWGLVVVSAPASAATTTSPAPVQTASRAPTQREADVLTLIAERKVEATQAGASVMFQTDGTGTLSTDGTVDVPLGQLIPGVTYGFMAVCDKSCGDLNLWLIDNNGWVNGAIDTETDNEPEISWTALANQNYRIRVHMISCYENPCNWGLVGASIR